MTLGAVELLAAVEASQAIYEAMDGAVDERIRDAVEAAGVDHGALARVATATAEEVATVHLLGLRTQAEVVEVVATVYVFALMVGYQLGRRHP